MGIIDKDGAMYLATGVDTTGLLEGKREVLEILTSLMRETASLDVFSGVELAAATAFTRAAAGTHELSRAFEYNMGLVAELSPLIAASFEDYEDRVIGMTRTIPVAADDCAAALHDIVTAGYDGSEAMNVLALAAREAVVATTGVVEAFARMLEGGQDLSAWKAGFSDVDFSESVSGMEAQVQLLQNNILAVTRKMGDLVTRQVASVAARLGDALSDGRVEKSFRSLETLITLASGVLADYRKETEKATGKITAEGAALEIANGIRQAYHELVENGMVQREAELQQQEAYRANLVQNQALEAGESKLKEALETKSLALGDVVAWEDAAYRRKLTDMRELLASQQEELAMNERVLASAEILLQKKKEAFESANQGDDVAKMELANTELLSAAEQKEAAVMEVANMERKVKGMRIRLNTLERRGETAAIATSVTATNAESLANAGNTTTTGILTRAKQRLTLAMRSLSASIAANPLGMLLSVVSLAITAFSMFGKKTEDSASALDKLNEALDKQKERVNSLVNTLYDENEAEQRRVAALLELRKLYPEVWDKVDLTNLKEQKRIELIKQGNEALEERKEKELEAAVAASKTRIAEMEKKGFMMTVTTPENEMLYVKDTVAVSTYENEKKKLEEYEEELKNIRNLKAAVARESMMKEEKLAEYNRELETLSGKLKTVRDRIVEIKTKIQNAGNPFTSVLDQAQLTGLEQQEKELQGQADETTRKKKALNKPTVMTEEERKKRQESEKSIQETVDALALKYAREGKKKEIAGMNEGHLKLIAEIREEYADRGRVIEQEEKKLQEKYDDLKEKMPDDVKQMFAKQKQLNKEEEEKQVREVKEQNKAEVSGHFLAMREKATSGNITTEEDRSRGQVNEQYKNERTWLEGQKGNGMPEMVAENYNANINLAEQKEQHARLLSELNDFNQKRETIIAEWEAKKATAKVAAKVVPELGDDNLVARLEEEKQKVLGALGTEELMQSEAWTGLFDHLDELTISQIDKLIGDVQAKMGEVQKEIGVDNAKISPVDMKVIVGKLGEAKQQIATLNPFRALGDSMKEIFGKGADEAGKSSVEVGDKWKNLGKTTAGCFDFVNDAVGSCSVLSDVLGESGQQTMGMIQGVATAGIAMSSAIKGVEKGSVILAVISAALMAVNALASLFNGDKKQEKKIKRLQGQIDDLERSYNRLGTTIDNTYSEEVYGMMDEQNEKLREQQELIKQQIEAEDKKKKTDKGKIKDWENEIEDINEKIEENKRKQIEMLAGTDVQSAIDTFADALTEAYAKGEDGATALGATTKKVMANAVKEALKKKFLGDSINEAVNYLGNAMSDGVLSAEEQAKFEQMVQAGGENFTKAMGAYQNLLKEADGTLAEGVTGQLQAAMTEGTASQLVGLWNTTASDVRAIRDWLLMGTVTVPESPFNMTQMIELQNEIAVNTRVTAQSTTATMHELRDGLGRMDQRLEAIDRNTRGYAGRGR